jgi:hypothetical protein
MKQTAVEWLAEKYNYVTWMSNRDEISAGMADEWRKHYLEQAKAMEKEQIIDAYDLGSLSDMQYPDPKTVIENGEQYYNETYGQWNSGTTSLNN